MPDPAITGALAGAMASTALQGTSVPGRACVKSGLRLAASLKARPIARSGAVILQDLLSCKSRKRASRRTSSASLPASCSLKRRISSCAAASLDTKLCPVSAKFFSFVLHYGSVILMILIGPSAYSSSYAKLVGCSPTIIPSATPLGMDVRCSVSFGPSSIRLPSHLSRWNIVW